MNIKWIGSPNYTAGRGGKQVGLIVVHHMAGTLAATDAVFQDKVRNTSAHYGIGRNGEVHQYVKESDTAYHAGDYNVNERSIGIEHEDLAADNYTDLEYETSAALIRDLCTRYGLPIDRATIHPHHDYTATACPGTLDIDRLINLAKGGTMEAWNVLNGSAPADSEYIRQMSQYLLLRKTPMGDQEINSFHQGKTKQRIFDEFCAAQEGKDARTKLWAGGTGKALADYTAQELINELVRRAK